MKKIKLFLSILLLLFCVVTVSSSYYSTNSNNDILAQKSYIFEESKDEKYEYYEYTIGEDNILLEAVETRNCSDIKNLGYEYDDNTINIAYSLNYDIEADAIFITITTSSDNALINVEKMTAYPFRYDDDKTDAYIYLNDGSTIYLSEIYDENIQNCFALTLGFSLAALISTMITVAKVAAVITAVVVVSGITIQVAQMTKVKLEERTRAAEAEKTKKNPQYYYPATRKNGKLLISSTPQGLIAASKAILTGVDYWSPYSYTAKNLAVNASGGSVGPEVDSNSNGKYYHYHLLGRIGGHSFFGSPVGGAF